MNSLCKRLQFLFLFAVVTGCNTYPIKSDNTTDYIFQRYFGQPFEKGLVYKANFRFKEKSISGLMVIKYESPNQTRIQLLTHLGPTLMDVTLMDDKMIVHQNLKNMNKKIILKNLEKDLRQIILNPLTKENIKKIVHYKNDNEFKVKTSSGEFKIQLDKHKNIKKVARLGIFNSEKVVTEYSEIVNETPNKISLYHKNIDFRIELNLLKQF